MTIGENLWKNKHFYASCGSMNLGALCVGLAIGWPRPSFAYLQENIEPSLLYADEAWIESTINVGASLGSLASIFISDFYGRRISFSLSAGILLAFWIFLSYSSLHRILIISAAALAGLAAGIFSATAVLYVAEVSTLENRGAVGTTAMLFGCLGVFAINLFGYFFDISLILSIMAALPLCFLLSVHAFVIESPFYLYHKGNVLEAKICLKRLRDKSVLQVDDEFRAMQAFFNVNFSREPRQQLLESRCPKSLRLVALIATPVLCISQMLGVMAVGDYAEQLIESIYPDTGGILTSFIDVVSSVLCMFAIERLGRKALLTFAIVGSGLCCLVLAVYNLTENGQCYTEKLLMSDTVLVLPTVVLCAYYAIYALGLIPVLPIVTGEIFPYRAKTAAVGICTSLFYLIAFAMQRSYEALNRYTSSCFAFVCFAMLASIGLPFAVTILPETKGKSLLQIQTEMANGLLVNY